MMLLPGQACRVEALAKSGRPGNKEFTVCVLSACVCGLIINYLTFVLLLFRVFVIIFLFFLVKKRSVQSVDFVNHFTLTEVVRHSLTPLSHFTAQVFIG